MIIGRILSPVYALGPGARIGLWVKGCSKKCPGCMSVDLQVGDGENIDEKNLADAMLQLAKMNDIKAITISGGDPFEQAEALKEFLLSIRGSFEDILVYTGYTLQEIMQGASGQSGIDCINLIDVLIDGRYEEANNVSDSVLRGSSNQNINFLNQSIEGTYLEYMKMGRMVETFQHSDETIVVGILNKEEHE
jgi:anaerobic ribonucleoside-triphosphate reductase activating protein